MSPAFAVKPEASLPGFGRGPHLRLTMQGYTLKTPIPQKKAKLAKIVAELPNFPAETQYPMILS